MILILVSISANFACKMEKYEILKSIAIILMGDFSLLGSSSNTTTTTSTFKGTTLNVSDFATQLSF